MATISAEKESEGTPFLSVCCEKKAASTWEGRTRPASAQSAVAISGERNTRVPPEFARGGNSIQEIEEPPEARPQKRKQQNNGGGGNHIYIASD